MFSNLVVEAPRLSLLRWLGVVWPVLDMVAPDVCEVLGSAAKSL